MMLNRTKDGFTMIEIIVVLIIVASISAFAIPRYNLTVELSHRRDAEMKLQSIHAAMAVRIARMGYYWPFDYTTHQLASINSSLGLNIIAEGFTYTCNSSDPGNGFVCSAARTGAFGDYVVNITEAPLSTTNPSCTGNCP